MSRASLTTCLLFTLITGLFSQEFEVRSFEKDPKDISAIRFPRKDVNNQDAAIIKVRTNLNGLKYECNFGFIGDPDVKEGEVWLYVSPREKRLKFIKNGFITKDYIIDEIVEHSTVYILELTNRFQTIDKADTLLGFLLIKSVPLGAEVWIDSLKKGTTPHTEILSFGIHSLRLVHVGYLDIEESITITQKSEILTFSLIKNELFEIPEMVFVEEGTFLMGSNRGSRDERPVHLVKINSFYIGKFEVTQKQWRFLMGKDPENLKFTGCNQCPVEGVSWYDIQEFLKRLNTISGQNYRLPTEAEWEFAARGGNQSKGFSYSGSNNIVKVAWYRANSNSKSHPVGQKQPNELGIFDLTGNVWEWCSDYYDERYYRNSTSTNPSGPISGDLRVLRGGAWLNIAEDCKVWERHSSFPSNKEFNYGFRLCLTK